MTTTVPMINTKLFISSLPIDIAVTNTSTLYAALTWNEVKGITAMGKTGDMFAPVKNEVISDGRVHYSKGSADGGSPTFDYLPIAADPGQALLVTALAATGDYGFKMLYNDKPTAGTSGTINYYGGVVMQNAQMNGTSGNSLKFQAMISVNAALIIVPAV